MSSQSQNHLKSSGRRVRRTFSSEFKRAKVGQIEAGVLTVADIVREYDVWPSAVYRWIDRYGTHAKAASVVIQLDSEEHRTKLLRAELNDLERALGRKQMEIDYLNALIDASSQELGIDLKKSSSRPSSSTFGSDPRRGTGR